MQSDEERELEQEGAEEGNEAEQMDQGSDEEQLGDDPFVPVEDGSDEEQLGDDQPFPDALREIALILFHNRYHRPQTHESLMQGLFGGAREEENDEEEDSSRVREAIESTPRALFVPPEAALFANNDMPLDLHPYGLATNLSAPHIYPRVLQLLRVAPGMKVLDVGCGTGCLATMCLRLGGQVEGWDIDERVLDFARHVAARKGFPVCYRLFNAFWPPLDSFLGAFDRVHVGAAIAPARIPHFMRLLRVGGLLVAPVRDGLYQITKLDEAGNREEKCDSGVRFRTLVEPVESGEWAGAARAPPHVKRQIGTLLLIWSRCPEHPLSALPRELLRLIFARLHPYR